MRDREIVANALNEICARLESAPDKADRYGAEYEATGRPGSRNAYALGALGEMVRGEVAQLRALVAVYLTGKRGR